MLNDNVLITGAGGFIGSHLVEECIKQGFKIKAMVRYNSRNDTGWLSGSEYKNEIEFVRGDVRDYDSVLHAMRGCNSVFHLAALIGIPYSYYSPLAYIRTNVEGSYNILQAARSLSLDEVVITSSSETYGSAQYVPIDENHPLVGQSPYSASKIAADQLAISYYRSFGLPVKIIRPFNTYGPRQSARAVIPTIILQLLNGRTKIKLGSLTPKRDFTFVGDTVKGFLEIFRSDSLYGEVTNIGMNEEHTIDDIVKILSKELSVRVNIEEEVSRVRPVKSEVDRLRCENSKILSETSWNPGFNIISGLKDTVDWFRENLKYYNLDEYTI